MVAYFMQSCVIHGSLCHQTEARVPGNVCVLMFMFRVDNKDTMTVSNGIVVVSFLLNVI